MRTASWECMHHCGQLQKLVFLNSEFVVLQFIFILQVCKRIFSLQLSVRVQLYCFLSNGGRCFSCNSTLFQAWDLWVLWSISVDWYPTSKKELLYNFWCDRLPSFFHLLQAKGLVWRTHVACWGVGLWSWHDPFIVEHLLCLFDRFIPRNIGRLKMASESTRNDTDVRVVGLLYMAAHTAH